MFDPSPITEDQLFSALHHPDDGMGQHLLTIYALAIGIQAKTLAELGIGASTKTLRAVAVRNGGCLRSCDCDRERFAPLLERQDEHWRLELTSSEKFIQQLEPPLDFFMHDGAHDYYQVKLDLELIIPRMKKFGIICIHDTQQTQLSHEMMRAIQEIMQTHPLSAVSLPFSAGLTIMRVEESTHPAIVPMGGKLSDGRFNTAPIPFALQPAQGQVYEQADHSLKRWLRWRLRKVVKGY